MRSVELRCPVGPRALLSKVLLAGDRPDIVDGNLVELNCEHCKRSFRKSGRPVRRVLHRFNLAGEMVESVVE